MWIYICFHNEMIFLFYYNLSCVYRQGSTKNFSLIPLKFSSHFILFSEINFVVYHCKVSSRVKFDANSSERKITPILVKKCGSFERCPEFLYAALLSDNGERLFVIGPSSTVWESKEIRLVGEGTL